MILLFLCIPAVFFAKPFWKIQRHKLDSQTLQKEMNALWQDKYSPIGMELYEDQMYVLYINYQAFASDYFLEVIDLDSQDEESLPRKLNERMENAYIPMAISVYKDQLYLIYLKSPMAVLEWDLLPLPDSYEDQEALLNEKGESGLAPLAITAGAGQKFVLMARLQDWEVKEWLLKSYQPESKNLKDGLNEAIKNDWIPWGLMMNKDEWVVLYIRQ